MPPTVLHAQAEQLGRIQGLQAYHQKDLAHLLSQAKLYTLMGTAERAQYLEETHAFVRSVQWYASRCKGWC